MDRFRRRPAVDDAGLARGAGWARTPAYAIVGAYTLLGASVAGMGITMYHNDDPDASLIVAAGFTLFALVFAALSFALYRPLFEPTPGPEHNDPGPGGATG